MKTLTEQDIAAIRASTMPNAWLARRYGVSRETIRAVISRKEVAR